MYNKQIIILVALTTILSVVSFQPHSGMKRGVTSIKLRSAILEELSTGVDENRNVGSNSVELPPLLQEMVNERRKYEMNLGRAMDVLRKDYPYMLYKTPGT